MGFESLLEDRIQSKILTTVIDPNYDFNKLHDLLFEKGFTIYPGKIGEKDTFRIANMSAIDYKDIKRFLIVIKETLHEMEVKLT